MLTISIGITILLAVIISGVGHIYLGIIKLGIIIFIVGLLYGLLFHYLYHFHLVW